MGSEEVWVRTREQEEGLLMRSISSLMKALLNTSRGPSQTGTSILMLLSRESNRKIKTDAWIEMAPIDNIEESMDMGKDKERRKFQKP